MNARLDTVKTVGALLLFEQKIFRSEILIFDVREKLNAKLILPVECQIQISLVLSPEPIRVLLRQVNLSPFLNLRRVEKRVPRLVVSFHCEERVRMVVLTKLRFLAQNVVCEDP